MQEWPVEAYPPWAHGPGYIVSRDIAKFIVHGHQERTLQVTTLSNDTNGLLFLKKRDCQPCSS